MIYPTTVFDRPQWNLLPDPSGVRMYANVSNRLEVVNGRSHYAVALSVPTELFTFMRLVLNVPVGAPSSLSMDNVAGWYILSLMVEGAEDRLYDLWAQKQLPDWFADRQYRA